MKGKTVTYFQCLDSASQERYKKKLSLLNLDQCPFEIEKGKWEDNMKMWPDVLYPDIFTYLIDSPGVHTKDAIKASRATITSSLDMYRLYFLYVLGRTKCFSKRMWTIANGQQNLLVKHGVLWRRRETFCLAIVTVWQGKSFWLLIQCLKNCLNSLFILNLAVYFVKCNTNGTCMLCGHEMVLYAHFFILFYFVIYSR